MSIVLSNISKNFGEFSARHDIDLEISEDELVMLLRSSGCGKTTLLPIIAGLEQTVLLNSEDKTNFHVSQHGIGFLFQHYALFRYMTVFDNVAFGMRVKDKKLRPHDVEITKVTANTNTILKDWQHLGALIRIELTKILPNGNQKAVFAEMPNEQFKRLKLSRGDKVDLKIRHAHWFH